MSGTYTYNGDGLRASRNIGGTIVSYTWDVSAGLPVILQDSQGSSYVYGLDLISRTDSGGNQEYYLYDGLGSTTDLTNGSGTTIASYSYDVFGAIRSQTGSSANEFKFTGEQVDSTSLQYLRARYYDPAIGRFLSQDPVAGSAGDPGTLNRYAYVLNNPIGRVDPLGYQGAEVAAGTVTVSCTAGAAASVGSACVVGLAVAGGVVVYYTCYVGEACDALGGAMIDGAGKIANASADAVTGVGEGALDLGGDVIGGIKGLFSKGDSKYHPKYNEDPGLRNIGHEFRRPTSWNFPWPPRGCAQFQGIRKAVCWAFVAGGLSYAGDRLIGPFLGGTAPPLAGEKSP